MMSVTLDPKNQTPILRNAFAKYHIHKNGKVEGQAKNIKLVVPAKLWDQTLGSSLLQVTCIIFYIMFIYYFSIYSLFCSSCDV